MQLNTLSRATIDDLKYELSRMLADGIYDPSVQMMSQIAVAGQPDQIRAVYDFVKTNFPYVPDEQLRADHNLGSDGEFFTSPKRAAESYFNSQSLGFDCDCHSLLVASMLGSLGYNTRIALIDLTFDGEPDHAIAEVFSPYMNGWIYVDTTDDYRLGWGRPGISQEVYVEGV